MFCRPFRSPQPPGTTLTLHDLVHLARSLQLDSLEAAWSQAAKSPQATDSPRYAATIEALCERDMAGRALALATSMVESLQGNGMLEEAIDLAHRVVKRGAHNEALARQLVALLEKRYSGEDWYAIVLERSGLNPQSINAQAILEFDRLRRYTKGHVVYHSAGWGEGVVEGFHAGRREIAVQFASGRREDFPLDTVIARDVKGLYKRALAGEIPHFTGISDPYEPPLKPEVVLKTGEEPVENSAERVFGYLRGRGLVR